MGEAGTEIIDCNLCEYLDFIQKNDIICFLDEQSFAVDFPVINEEGKQSRIQDKNGKMIYETISKRVDGQEFLEELWELQNSMRPRPVLLDYKGNGLLGSEFQNVCPRSLINSLSMMVVEMESDCKEYGKLPDPGALLDQNRRIMEMFRCVRAARSAYTADYMRQTRNEATLKGAGNK